MSSVPGRNHTRALELALNPTTAPALLEEIAADYFAECFMRQATACRICEALSTNPNIPLESWFLISGIVPWEIRESNPSLDMWRLEKPEKFEPPF